MKRTIHLIGMCILLMSHLSFADTANRKLIYQDNFEKKTNLSDYYFLGKEGSMAWFTREGALIGQQTRKKHGSVFRKMINFKDIDIEMDFRFDGGKSFNFVLDDDNEKSVHAAHIARVSISPKKLSVRDDKTGVMNKEIRKMRQNKSLSEEKKSAIEKLLKTKINTNTLKLQKGQWYHLRILMKGDLLEAFIDGESIAKIRSPGIDHPAKTKVGMTVQGTAIAFDNLSIYAVEN